MNVKKIIKGIIGLGTIGGIAYAAYKLGECSGEVNERMREKYGDDDEDSIDLDDDEEDADNYYGTCFEPKYDEPDDECLAPMNGNSSHEEQYPDHHGTHSPIGYDENCENGDCFYVRLNAIDLDDIPTETVLRALVATKHSSYITNKAIRAATGCSYDTAERILILFEDAGYISEKNNRFRHKVYIKNVELTKLI